MLFYFTLSVVIINPHMTRVTRKQTLRSLSLSYQKKDGRVWPCPSFFWYDTDFSEFDSADIIDYIFEKSVSYQKKDWRGHARPSFFWYDNDKDLKVCFLVMCVNYNWAFMLRCWHALYLFGVVCRQNLIMNVHVTLQNADFAL